MKRSLCRYLEPPQVSQLHKEAIRIPLRTTHLEYCTDPWRRNFVVPDSGALRLAQAELEASDEECVYNGLQLD
ncbi:UNVERIFIED_CONTAM: hypothetical protein FKN15_041530 [Acipenser sinensis]